MSNLEISRAQRLDQRVVEQMPTLTRNYAATLIDDGKVTVNGVVVTKAGYKMKPGDKVTIDHDEDMFYEIPSIDLQVLYEDDDCVVVNKPTGVLTHSKGAFHAEATVATWLRGRLRSMEGERAGIVHRLDRDTSGVMICAKTPDTHNWLQRQFSQRHAKKQYVAVIEGVMHPEQAIIDMPIERNPKKPQTFRVGINGRSAVTAYESIMSNDTYTMLRLRPTTGRTHQLRVHLMHFKRPIVGDRLYGGRTADRLYLHAAELTLILPNGSERTFTAPVPDAFTELLKD
ncbi:MAG TPA: RluA family pseudouridine synthase [Candidatus Saccharimonadales bacterium]|jgi:23S rRNA pseudouridine1911/1915/1917 synthase